MEASEGTQPEEPTGTDPAARPDDDAGPAVEPTKGTQGEQVGEDAAAAGFDPDAPARTSAPAPEDQPGVPDLPDGSNEGVEAQPEYAGPVGDSGQSPGGSHPEASQADNADEGTAPGGEGEASEG